MQATCKGWAKSKVFLPRELLLKFRPEYVCSKSAGRTRTSSPHKSTTLEVSNGDVVNIFVFSEVSCKPQTANSGIKDPTFKSNHLKKWPATLDHQHIKCWLKKNRLPCPSSTPFRLPFSSAVFWSASESMQCFERFRGPKISITKF